MCISKENEKAKNFTATLKLKGKNIETWCKDNKGFIVVKGDLMLILFCREDSVKQHTKQTDPVEVMGALRNEKDNWKPPKL